MHGHCPSYDIIPRHPEHVRGPQTLGPTPQGTFALHAQLFLHSKQIEVEQWDEFATAPCVCHLQEGKMEIVEFNDRCRRHIDKT